MTRTAPSLPRALLLPVPLLLTALSWAGCGARQQQTPLPAKIQEASGKGQTKGQKPADTVFQDVSEDAGLRYAWKVTASRPLNALQTIGNGCAFLDYDNDGNLDILLVGPSLALYKGDGKGHFTDVTTTLGLDRLRGQFLGCAVGDYDNDGYPDLYLSGYRTGLLLHNEQGKRFRDVTAAAGLKPQPWGTSAIFFDYDGDGALDLYVCNYLAFGPDTVPQLCEAGPTLKTACGPRWYGAEKGVLYRNLGQGRFADVTQASGAGNVSGKALGVAAADYNGSGHAACSLPMMKCRATCCKIPAVTSKTSARNRERLMMRKGTRAAAWERIGEIMTTTANSICLSARFKTR